MQTANNNDERILMPYKEKAKELRAMASAYMELQHVLIKGRPTVAIEEVIATLEEIIHARSESNSKLSVWLEMSQEARQRKIDAHRRTT